MLHAISLVLLIAPQEPLPSSVFADLHAAHDVDAQVEAARERLTRIKVGSVRSVVAPDGLARLRAAGADAVGLVDRTFALDADRTSPLELMELVALQWSRRPKRVPSKPVDLAGFEKLCERVYRDLHKALGSGRDLGTTALQLVSVMEHVRPRAVVGGWDKPTLGLIEERFDRVGRVARDDLVMLSRRLVAGALDLIDPKLSERLRRQQAGPGRLSVKGPVLDDRTASFGRFVVGGFGDNEYDCSQVDVIVDFGGNDIYRGPAGGAGGQRRMALVIDLDGDDVYQALNGALGSATFGIGVLIDCAGDDVYQGGERCLGFGAAGVGVAIDFAGDDRFEIGPLSGGVGLAGVGLFADLAGNDVHRAGVECLGCGLPGGLGLFVDAAGDDQRTLELVALDHGGRRDEISVGLGAGFGAVPDLEGGIGIYLDLAGDDTITAAGLVCGVGARGGAGVFRDAAGTDVYRVGAGALGAAFSQGVGVAIDCAGDDSYAVTELALGAASGGGCGWFVDLVGDDGYAAGAASFGSALLGGVAGFADLAGQDSYERLPGELAWPLGGDQVTDDAIATFLDDGGDGGQFEKLGMELAEGVVRLESDRLGAHEVRIVVRR